MLSQSRLNAHVTSWKLDAPAWSLAYLPLATTLANLFAATIGVSTDVVSLATILAAVALVIIDKRELRRTDRIPWSSLPFTVWSLVPPVYLFKRARRLGIPKTQFWVSIVCSVLAFVISTAVVARMATSLADADLVLPDCADRGSMSDVLSVFDDIESVRSVGLHGVIVTDQTEVGQGPGASPKARFCTGVMHASNEREYDMRYGFEIIQGQVIVHVQLQ